MKKSLSPRPLSIKVLAIEHFISVPATILLLVLFKDAGVIFGVTIHGWVTVLFTLCYAGLALYLGFGLWKLQERARKIAIWYWVYALVNIWLYTFNPATQIEVTKVVRGVLGTPSTGQLDTSPLRTLPNAIGVTITSILSIWFLIKRKSAFIQKNG